MSEKTLHKAVTDYIKLAYPHVKFRSDTGAGTKLTIGQAKAQKAIQNGDAWPDLMIAEARGGWFGLFIELKKVGTILKKKNGMYATTHLIDQADCLEALQAKNYKAEFAVGFDEAKSIIDNYMKHRQTLSAIV